MNRREHPRVTLIGKVDIRSGNSINPGAGYAINISRGGLALYSDRVFGLNAELLLTIFLKYGYIEEREDISGIVKWNRTVGDDIFAIGVQYREIREEIHPMIFSYIGASMDLARPRSSEG